MGAALSTAPLGLVTLVSPAVSHAECTVEGAGVSPTSAGGGEVKCSSETNEAEAAPAPQNQWAIDPNLTPAENLVNLQKLPPPQLSEPLVQTSLVDDVPVEIAPTLGLPGIGVGVNLWPDLTPIVNGVTGAAVGAALPAAPDLSAIGGALSQLPPPQLPPPPSIPRPGPICGPAITPFFTPCI
jgi:hypothetical protein